MILSTRNRKGSSNHDNPWFQLPSWCKAGRWGRCLFCLSWNCSAYLFSAYSHIFYVCDVHWLLHSPSLIGHSPIGNFEFFKTELHLFRWSHIPVVYFRCLDTFWTLFSSPATGGNLLQIILWTGQTELADAVTHEVTFTKNNFKAMTG